MLFRSFSSELAAVLVAFPPLLYAGAAASKTQNDALMAQLLGPAMTGVEHFDYAQASLGA